MKKLKDFEQTHGGERVRELKKSIDRIANKRREVEVLMPDNGNSIAFGLIGDTHYGSLFEAKDEVEAFYRRCDAEGIRNVIHAGDVVDGHGVYRGQEFELHRHGWAQQREWFAKVAPKVEGITTWFVAGNHDLSMKKAAGVDVGPSMVDRRPDWVFLGEDQGRVVFKLPGGAHYVVQVLHPGGGASYALSYRGQKITESLEGGTKPDLLAIGHYHKAEMMPNYRNVCVVQVGTFQWQTPFMATKGLAAHVGGWLVRATVGTQGKSTRCEFVSFWK